MDTHCLHCQRALGFAESVRGELFCSANHRELYLQGQPAAVVFRPPTDESLMRVVERIKARKAAVRPAPAVPEFATYAKLHPRGFIGLWRPSSIAACVAILALTATFFESPRKGAHLLSPLVLAAEPRVDQAPQFMIPVPDPPPVLLAKSEPPAREPKTRHLSIQAKGTTWLAACSDGKEVLRTVLSTGDSREIDFSDKAIVRTGNAGGTDISVDGRTIGSAGPDGALRVIELGGKGYHLLSLGPVDDGRDCGNR